MVSVFNVPSSSCYPWCHGRWCGDSLSATSLALRCKMRSISLRGSTPTAFAPPSIYSAKTARSRSAARASRDTYLEALRGIQERKLDCNISIKLSQMGLRFDLDLCREIVRDLLVAAGEVDNFVRIDMEDSSVTDVTLDMYREFRKEFAHVGTVVQSYLKRTHDDVASMLEEGPTHLRLCKGIYVEPEEIAYKDRQRVRDNYVDVMKHSLDHGIAVWR